MMMMNDDDDDVDNDYLYLSTTADDFALLQLFSLIFLFNST